MKNKNYITKYESERCRRVTNLFRELYERTDIFVVDAGKYGYVLLKYFDSDCFQNIQTYTDSCGLFNALWQEWVKEKLTSYYIDTPMIDLEYADMFKRLPEESQSEILESKKKFLDIIGHEDVGLNIISDQSMPDTVEEKNKCRTVADIFKRDLEKEDIVIEEIGKYGYIMLQYYEPKANFDSATVFTDSQEMFDALLDEWFACLITNLMDEKQITNEDIDTFYNKLSKEDKDALNERKERFVEQARKRL